MVITLCAVWSGLSLWDQFVNREGTTAPVSAAQTGDAHAFAELVRRHQYLTVAYVTAILGDHHLAEDSAGQGHEPFVRLMLRYRLDLATPIAVGVRIKGPESPIETCELTELLSDNGMDPNPPNWLRITPLYRVTHRGDVESAALFINHGANVYARDEEPCSTPLGWAAKCAQIERVRLLVKHGAKTNLPDYSPSATPLAWAKKRGHMAITELPKAAGRTV